MTNPDEIRLNHAQRRSIARLADRLGRSWQSVLDELIPVELPGVALEDGESALDAAIRLGLVGVCSSGTPDLATNPEHMKGLGESQPPRRGESR